MAALNVPFRSVWDEIKNLSKEFGFMFSDKQSEEKSKIAKKLVASRGIQISNGGR
jgi:hypothetical protein